MKTNELKASMKRRKPLFGAIGLVIALFSIIMGVLLGQNLAGQIDIHIRNILPFVAIVLSLIAFIRLERVIWPIITILLTGFYFALHLIPSW
jgi:sorbitol-specific phosphotransferase system component IIBC